MHHHTVIKSHANKSQKAIPKIPVEINKKIRIIGISIRAIIGSSTWTPQTKKIKAKIRNQTPKGLV